MVTRPPVRSVNLKGAIFDWDGTLLDIDGREFYCINAALKAHGIASVTQDFFLHNYYRRPFEVGTGPTYARPPLPENVGTTLAPPGEVRAATPANLMVRNDPGTRLPGSTENVAATSLPLGIVIGVAGGRTVPPPVWS